MDIRPVGNAVQQGTATADKIAIAAEAAVANKAAAAPAEPIAAVQQPTASPSLAEVSQALKSINKAMQEQSRGLEFTVDSDNDRTIIKVVDQNTKEVVRQIPSEEALEIARALDRVQQGLLIRQKV